MKNYEKKSFLTSIYLFFIPLMLFASIVLYMYHQDKVKSLKQTILYQMKDYTFDFKGDEFSLDIVQEDKSKETFKIYNCEEGLCAYFKAENSGPYLLKVIFDKEKYKELYDVLFFKILQFSIIIFILLFILSIGFALYSLRPMKEALTLLETFLKDLIHDLNTPATSILLNSKLLRRKGDFAEIERIELSAKSISSLYKNLEFINPKKINKDEKVDIKELIINKIEILQKIYPDIKFIDKTEKFVVNTNRNGLDRILDNILTNACKYNKKKGEIIISNSTENLFIEDTGIGIKNVKKVFQRYYKENERGMGIGMNIVKQLCDMLDIKISIKSEIEKGTSVKLTF